MGVWSRAIGPRAEVPFPRREGLFLEECGGSGRWCGVAIGGKGHLGTGGKETLCTTSMRDGFGRPVDSKINRAKLHNYHGKAQQHVSNEN